MNAQALFQSGLSLHQQGQIESAKQMYEAALALTPDHFDALHLLGVIAAGKGEAQEAIAYISQALKSNTHYAPAWYNLALAQQQLKDYRAALSSYECAIALKKDYWQAYSNRGSVLKELNRLNEALASYDMAFILNPQDEGGYVSRGSILMDLQCFESSLESLNRALVLHPFFANTYYNRGNLFKLSGQSQMALQNYDQAIALDPQPARYQSNRGLVLLELQRYDEALQSCDRAIRLDGTVAEAYVNRANVLQSLMRREEAIKSLEKAIEYQSDYAVAFNNLGVAWHECLQLKTAIDFFARAIVLDPSYELAYWNKSLAHLLMGDWATGWKLYEWRWRTQALKAGLRLYDKPQWSGQVSLKEKCLLIYAEQGLGDTIQFCRYALLLAQQARQVILLVQPSLKNLLQWLPNICVLGLDEPAPAFDYYCPLMSLPGILKTEPHSVPCFFPYLSAPPEALSVWSTRLGIKQKKRIGLVWSGGFRAHLPEVWAVNQRRNLPFEALNVFEGVDAQFYSLQKGEPAESEFLTRMSDPRQRFRVENWSAELKDFTDTAGLIGHLDLVISVDTSTAHLAAAMGKTVWILNRYDTCWRWLLDRDDSVWYPNVRLFRQNTPGDWEEVVERVSQALKVFVGQSPEDI